MIRRVDMICPVEACAHRLLDVFLAYEALCPCPTCGTEMIRLWVGDNACAGIIGDDIPGGVEIKHGLCNSDGSARRYYSKTEIANEAKRRGLQSHVEHVTPKGTDKSPHTTRWY